MDKLKMFKWLWGCVTIVFVVMFVASSFLETMEIYKLSGGTEIKLELGGLIELSLVIAAYFLSEEIIRNG